MMRKKAYQAIFSETAPLIAIDLTRPVIYLEYG